MTNKRIIVVVFVLSIISQYVSHHLTSSVYLYASSDSFANQQIKLGRNLTQDCPSNQANISKSLANDIVGVTYSSDGRKLVLTVWFKDAIMLKDNQSLHGKEITAHIPPQIYHGIGKIQDLRNALREIAALYNKTLPKYADQLEITNNSDTVSLSIQNDGRNSSHIYAMFDLKNITASDLFHAVDIMDVMGVDYLYESRGRDIIRSFLQEYLMLIDIKSIYDSGWDYQTKLFWNGTENRWNYTMGQYDPSAPRGDPSKGISISPFPVINDNYIEYSVNLEALKNPDDLWIMFQERNTLLADLGRCQFYDRTDLISVPPPKLYLSANPNSLDLLPGERAKIKLTLNSSSDIGADVYFSIDNRTRAEESGIDFVRGPFPSNVTLPARSLVTSEMEVRPIVKNGSYTTVLRPFANISFVTPLKAGLFGNETTSLVHLVVDSEIPVSVKAPKGPLEQMAEGLDNAKVFTEKVSGIIAAIAIIAGAGGIGGFVALMKRIRKPKASQAAEDDTSKSESG